MFLLISNIFGSYCTKSYAAVNPNADQVILDEEAGGEVFDWEEYEKQKEMEEKEGMSDVSESETLEYWKPKLNGGANSLDEKVGVIATLIRTVGILASIISLSIIGIKFMYGSVDERAQYKQTLVPWVIGAIMVFAMTTIPTIIYEISGGIFN